MKRAQNGWVTLAQVSQQREESMDMIVPDISPDVFTVLSVTASCTVQETVLRQDRAELGGSAEVLVIYTSEEEKVCTMRGVLPLRHVCEAPGCSEKCVAQVRMEAVTSSAAVLNPRKLSLRVTVAEEVELWQERPFELCEQIAGAEGEGIQCRKTTETCMLLAAAAEKKVTFTEDLRLHGEAAGGTVLLRSETEWQTEEIRVMANKLLVRGTAVVKAVTVTDAGVYAGVCTYSLPFSQMMECDRAEPGDHAELSIVTSAMECRLVPAEGGMQLSIALTGSMAARMWREQRLQAVTDLYSTRYASAFETAALGGERMPETVECRADVREMIECPAAAQVCDWSCCMRGELLADGGLMCRYWFRVLYRTTEGCLRTVCRRCDVRMELEHVTRCCIRAENVRVTPAEGGLCVEFIAVAVGKRAAPCPMNQVCACRLDQTKPRPQPEPGTLLLRAAGPEESVWSIAKQYGVPPELLRTANKLGADAMVTPGQLIVVPFAG